MCEFVAFRQPRRYFLRLAQVTLRLMIPVGVTFPNRVATEATIQAFADISVGFVVQIRVVEHLRRAG